jgi:hypothetical protein
MKEAKPSAAPPSGLPDELNVFCLGDRTKVVAVSARPGPERFALTTAVLDALTRPGVVVATAEGAPGYREFFRNRKTASPPAWTVLEGGNAEGGIRATARALALARELVVDPDREEAVSALWLPAHVTEAFGLLPPDGTGLVIIDSWDGLLDEYLRGVPPASSDWPSPQELEKILVQTLRQHAQALVVVIVDSSSRSRIVDLADGVVEVTTRGQYGVLSGSILVTRNDGQPGVRTPVRFHLDGGRIRWHPPR